ncbi:hypothetical protein B0I37DRAFT_203711 [Chaetomium sp. MPI-CAGE-AT-0009]|nr:hypothetical protein B0I37DRAFT_203711 [Chaetomium sp. MPI-CAGE-AT-0009]
MPGKSSPQKWGDAPPSATWRPGLGHSGAAHRRCRRIRPRTPSFGRGTHTEDKGSAPYSSTGLHGQGGTREFFNERASSRKKGGSPTVLSKADRHEGHPSPKCRLYLLITENQKGDQPPSPIRTGQPASQPNKKTSVLFFFFFFFLFSLFPRNAVMLCLLFVPPCS